MARKGKTNKRSRASNQHRYVGVKRDNTLIRRDEVVNDRRRFMPEADDLPRRDDGQRSHIISYDEDDDKRRSEYKYHITGRIAFKDPKRVTVCKRRKARRRALFELQKIGKGKGGGQKRRKMNKYSKVVCRRR